MRYTDHPLARDLDHVLTHTRDVWHDVRGGRLFITGGTGFFGTWLLESFAWAHDALALDAHVVVLTRDADTFRRKHPRLDAHPAIAFHSGDVRDYSFPAGEFSHIVHAATAASFDPSAEPLTVFDTISAGTRRTIELASQRGARMLFTSSGAVYGRQPSELRHVPETYLGGPDVTNIRSAYAEGKRAAELLCAIFAEKEQVHTSIARCFAFAGPYLLMDGSYAIGNFVRDGLQGGPIQIEGDGTPYRSYLYAADLAIWLWVLLFRGASGRTYNVGSEDDLSIGELAHLVAQAFAPAREVVIKQQADPHKPVERYVPSTARARTELHLEQWIDLADGLQRMIAWSTARPS